MRGKIDWMEAATPRTIERYTTHWGGTSFGTKFEGLKVSMDLPEKIPGLYHAGSVGIIMSGWLGTINYGVIVANKIDRQLHQSKTVHRGGRARRRSDLLRALRASAVTIFHASRCHRPDSSPPPFLFVDEIVSESADGLVARKTWRAEEDFYQGHYPGAPITPGVLLCEAVFQTGALYLARAAAASGAAQTGVPLLAKISDVRFRQPVYPGDTITIEVKRKDAFAGFTLMTGTVRKGDVRVLNVDFSVAWKTPEGIPPPAV